MKRAIVERPSDRFATIPESVLARHVPEHEVVDTEQIWNAVRRQWWVVAVGAILGLACSAWALALSMPLYTATARILLDESRAQFADQVSATRSNPWSDATINNEIEVIKSQRLSLAVAEKLSLSEDEAFLEPPNSFWDMTRRRVRRAVRSLFEPAQGVGDGLVVSDQSDGEALLDGDVMGMATDAAGLRAARVLRRNLEASRVNRSFVLEIRYTDHDAARAAAIVGAYGEAYVGFQQETLSEVVRDMEEWFRERLQKIQMQSISAGRAVQEFRESQGIAIVRDSSLEDQQLAQITTQMMHGAARTAEAKARLEKFEELLGWEAHRAATAAVLMGEVTDDAVLRDLRMAYVDGERQWRLAAAVRRPDHPEVAHLRQIVATLEGQIGAELERITEGLRAAYELSLAREDALRASFESAMASSGGSSSALHNLRQLEAVAAAYSDLYRLELQRFESASQQQELPVQRAHIISAVETPRSASSPSTPRALALGLALGAFVGALFGAFREVGEHPLRTSGEVIEKLGVPCAGLLPGTRRILWRRERSRASRAKERTLYKVAAAVEAKGASGGGAVVGVASVTSSSETKKVAEALLRILSDRGHAVALLTAEGFPGLLEHGLSRCVGPEGLDNSVIEGRLLSSRQGEPRDNHPLTVQELPLRLPEFRARYEYTIVVLPALTRSVVADECSRSIDANVLVLPWGEVLPRLTRDALRSNSQFAERVATTVLTNADLGKARRYMSRKGFERAVLSS